MTTNQGEPNIPYSDLPSNPSPAFTAGFVAVGQPQSQYPQLSQPTQQQPYVQPTYVLQQQVIEVVEQKPVVDRHSEIMSRLHGKHCCFCFSYPVGVKILSGIQIVSWFIWSVAFVAAHMWWLWLFTVVAVVMCYYGFTGAHRLDERRLRMYFYYLVCMAVLYLVMILVFAAGGYAADIAGWVVSLIIIVYWCYVVRDFIRTIHEVDYGGGSFLNQYHHSSHSHSHHHDHHDHHDDHH